jgi:hypothetical protein
LAGPQRSTYILEISTHTHTPLPPLKEIIPPALVPIGLAEAGQTVQKREMKPGVTGKDLKLAEVVEDCYERLLRG